MAVGDAIGDLGLIGDTRTAALVDTNGRVVWLCLPHFDGEPVFAALVAGDGGGEFVCGPAGRAELIHRRYRDGSAVLETTWRIGDALSSSPKGWSPTLSGRCFLRSAWSAGSRCAVEP